jgi:hypothetical protein
MALILDRQILNLFAMTDNRIACLSAYKSQTTLQRDSQEVANNMAAEDADYIKLFCQMPPISKMDASLNSLKSCE